LCCDNWQWTKGTAPAAVDGFEIKRRGDRDVYAKITLILDYSPPRFACSRALQQLLGIELPDTKPRLLSALWQYIKVIYFSTPLHFVHAANR
jgi:SWI/SNF-related matrix-associated actin-dependent regulator of chromatin subfamily D